VQQACWGLKAWGLLRQVRVAAESPLELLWFGLQELALKLELERDLEC